MHLPLSLLNDYDDDGDNDDYGNADKDVEQSWLLNAFAMVSPRMLALFSIAPPCTELAPPLYGARRLFLPLFIRPGHLSSRVEVRWGKRQGPFFAFPIRTKQKVSAHCIRGVLDIHR